MHLRFFQMHWKRVSAGRSFRAFQPRIQDRFMAHPWFSRYLTDDMRFGVSALPFLDFRVLPSIGMGWTSLTNITIKSPKLLGMIQLSSQIQAFFACFCADVSCHAGLHLGRASCHVEGIAPRDSGNAGWINTWRSPNTEKVNLQILVKH